ncbi:MAG: DUF4296 domain-containing protein [Mangrovibacterium sp.]|nr:DUF4296 domain-containing protein [Mangrovibacterium sp.]
MMRKQNKCIHILVVFGFLMMVLPACKQKGYPKPEHLIGEKKMENILYDLHLSQALLDRFRYNDPDSLKLNTNDLYRSVLNKYHIEDSVLAKSVIYYSSYPKVYERIYARVIERMNMEQEEMNKQEEVKVNTE